SSSSTRSTRKLHRGKQVSLVVFDSERAKIEDKSSETGTSSTEIREVKQVPPNQ
ncbi:hypothetical protein GCK32_011882, partial [Trichostrongylus colubriformis]